jgi:hypothetical protein
MTQRMAVCAALVLAAPVFGQVPPPIPAAPAFGQVPAAIPAAACPCCAADVSPGPTPGCFLDSPASPAVPAFWFTGEYLFAWIPGDHIRPLITTGSANSPGVIGAPGTRTLFGDQPVNGGLRSGLRFQTGFWFNDERTVGIEAGTMILESQATGATFSSPGNAVLARPFFNTSTDRLDSVVIAFPGVASGAVAAQVRSGNFYEGHIDFAQNMMDNGRLRLDALVGYRTFRFDESLGIQDVTSNASGRFVSSDSFATRNQFNGGDFGVRARLVRGNFSADFLTKLAVGILNRYANISGQTTGTMPGQAPQIKSGGFLALASNSGSFSPNYATLFPEFGLNLAWQVLPQLKLRAGYSIFLLDRISRAADLVRLEVNPGQVPFSGVPLQPPNEPQFHGRGSLADLWFQTISLGAEFTF